ncbi:uncharacterized protein Dwil_GK28122 [Drosophila willistoni]|uniref:uncharacterized protein LOC26530124 n=1 Tax=Drosophila willistoni TaxID=7260 RepID=UPI0007326DE6|nr:uncharacterized protein LOC26530124 [Drosophila willistoni]KRF97985.1 uncharacterized protein Dwil_GK28122 [Drosophila willistoni]
MCAAALLHSTKTLINFRLNTGLAIKRLICSSSTQYQKRTSSDVERKLLHKDKLPESSYQLIYRAPIEYYVTWTKNISTLTVSVIGLVAAYQFATNMNFINLARKIDLATLVSHETDLYFFLSGFVLINLAIRIFVAKYPLRIYKSNDKYVAVYGSQMPLGTVKHFFNRGEIAEYTNFLNPWSHIMFKLGNRTSMLLIDYFKTPSEFHKLFDDPKQN